jgi:DNA repair protein RadC
MYAGINNNGDSKPKLRMNRIKQSISMPLIEEDTPGYKYLFRGPSSLSDVEVLAMVINPKSKDDSNIQLARRIYSDNDCNMKRISGLSVNELIRYEGISESKALFIRATLELSKRSMLKDNSKLQITKSDHAYEVFSKVFDGLEVEHFAIIILNRANRVITTRIISQGGITGTVVDPKVLFRDANEWRGTSIILGHNHPSGQCNPSEADISLTRKLKQAGELMELPVLDHIIYCDDRYYSFADEGRI